MDTNRFMSPAKAQYMQTYVSQFVPLPFELMQRKAQNEQANFDAVKQNWDTISSKMGEDVLDVDMDPLLSGAVDNLQNRISDALDKYQGDWRQLDNVVQNVGNEYRQWRTSGAGALAIQSKQLHDENVKEISESKISGRDKDLFSSYGKDRYADAGAAIEGNIYNKFNAYNAQDLQKLALEAIKELDPDQTSVASAGFNQDERLIVDFYRDNKRLTKDDINKAVKARIWNNEDFNDMISKKHEVYSYYGMIPEDTNIEQFKESMFQEMVGGFGDPYSYNQSQTRQHAKETAYGGALGKLKAKPLPAVLTKTNRHIFKQGDYKDVLDSDTPFSTYQKRVTNNLNEFNTKLKSKFKQQNISGSQYDKFIVDSAEKYGLDLNKESDQRMFLNGIANGSYDLSSDEALGLATTDLSAQNIKRMAKQTMLDMRNQERVLLDIGEELTHQHPELLTDYHDFKSSLEKVWSGKERLNKIIENPLTDDEVKNKAKEELRQLYDYEDKLSGESPMSTYVAPPQLELADIKLGEANAKMINAFNSKTGQDILKKRLKLAQLNGVNVSFQNHLPVYNSEGQYDPNMSDDLYKSYKTTLNNNKSLILNSMTKVYDPITQEVVEKSVDEALRSDARLDVKSSDNPNGVYKTYEEAYEAKKKELFSSEYKFGNSFNPVTNNMMVEVGDRYRIDLSTAPGHFDFTTFNAVMDPIARDEMTVNTYVNKALIDPASNTEVDDGVYIHTYKPNQSDKIDGNFEQKFKDGNVWSLRIDPNVVGRGEGESEFLLIPSSDARDFLVSLQKINEQANQTNGSAYNNEGRLIPADEAKKQLISLYTTLTKGN